MANYNIVCDGSSTHEQIKLNVLRDGVLKPKGARKTVVVDDGGYAIRCPLCRATIRISAEAAVSVAAVLDMNPDLMVPTVIPERFREQHADPWPAVRLELLTRMLGKMHKLRAASAPN